MWTPEYYVRLAPFPPGVEGVTVPNDDGTFEIYLSSRLSPSRRRETLEHELRHIMRDHFYQDRPVSDLEREADNLPLQPPPLPFPTPHPTSIPLFPSPADLMAYIMKTT